MILNLKRNYNNQTNTQIQEDEQKEISQNSDPKVIIKGINILFDDKNNDKQKPFKKVQVE